MKTLNRKILWKNTCKKINNSVHSKHVYAVMSILFDEIRKDLLNGNKIKINNLFTLKKKDGYLKKHYNYVLKKITESKAREKILITVSPKLRNKIIYYFDLDETKKINNVY